jgi:hypothetical protein
MADSRSPVSSTSPLSTFETYPCVTPAAWARWPCDHDRDSRTNVTIRGFAAITAHTLPSGDPNPVQGATVSTVTPDPMERLLRMAGLMWSNADRATRAWQMGEWALLHQVRADGSSKPRDRGRFLPDNGSSLDLGDAYFMPERGESFVSSTARFPVMNTAERLVGASQAFGASLEHKLTSTLSTGFLLCRSAIENAAKTIWLLADPNRAVRRARSLGYTERDIGYQKGYIAAEARFLKARSDDGRDATRQSRLSQVRESSAAHGA